MQPAAPDGAYPADGSTRTVFFAEVPDTGYNQYDPTHVRVWKLSGPLNFPKLPQHYQLSSTDGSSLEVPLANGVSTGGGQTGGHGAAQGDPSVLPVETIEGNRAISAIWLPSSPGANSGYVWFCTTAGGVDGNSSGTPKAYWFRADVRSYPNNVSALAGSIDPGTGIWTYYPTLGANACGDICLIYCQSSANPGDYPSIRYVWRKSFDPVGTFRSGQTLKASGSALISYYLQNGQRVYQAPRWGDFGTVTVDPVDGTFWGSHEYVHSSNGDDWGTWWNQIYFP